MSQSSYSWLMYFLRYLLIFLFVRFTSSFDLKWYVVVLWCRILSFLICFFHHLFMNIILLFVRISFGSPCSFHIQSQQSCHISEALSFSLTVLRWIIPLFWSFITSIKSFSLFLSNFVMWSILTSFHTSKHLLISCSTPVSLNVRSYWQIWHFFTYFSTSLFILSQ